MNAYLSLIGRGRGGRLFKAGRLLTFSAFRMGAYSRWALIRGWAVIRITTVFISGMLNIMVVKLHAQCIETSYYSAVFNYFIVGDVPVMSSQSAAAFTCE